MAAQHPDDEVLLPIAEAILGSAGGLEKLSLVVGELLRECIDGVIKTPKTGRRLYDELEKTEKTYIGTCVEIELRHRLKLARGEVLDYTIAGGEVDLKFSVGKSWMIPPEAFERPCIIISADESKARFRFGLFVARAQYLNRGKNRDQKCGISKLGQENIRWLARDEPYPPNFWQSVPRLVADKIAAGESGNERLVTLFREIRDRPISRKVVEDVAAQNDPMRRLRADKARGTRNRLAADSIVLLCGTWAGVQEFIAKVGLPALGSSEFMSHRAVGDELRLAKELKLV
jgi:hypothetical protein